MADLQVGNAHGLPAVGGTQRGLLATVTADGANTVTVDSVRKLYAGLVIDIVHKTSGAVLASARTITNITSAGVVTYDGADAAATTSHGIYPTGVLPSSGPNKTNVNGGFSDQAGFDIDDLDTIASMRARLTAINGSIYTAARLNQMTYNDMVYAIRQNDFATSIKA